MFEVLRQKGFEILTLHHAEAILVHDMPEAIREIEAILSEVELPVEELIRGGGGEGALTQRIRRAFEDDFGWENHNFEIRKYVDGEEKESISHKVDHVKNFSHGMFALEIEWNNKDPFYDRDLENFKRLHAEGVISIGGIITRGRSLQNSLREIVERFARNNGIHEIRDLSTYYNPTGRQQDNYLAQAERLGSFAKGWAKSFVSDKFATSTTHWDKLEDRVHRGVGNPCPLLLIGIPDDIVVFGNTPS